MVNGRRRAGRGTGRRYGRIGAALGATALAAVCWAPALAAEAQARPAGEACGYSGTDLDFDGLARTAREKGVGEAVRQACSPTPTPPPPKPTPSPPPPPPKPAPPPPPPAPTPPPSPV
ncbi:hypothetical protein U9R90_04675, partial [Streptomyces sp. E11-3]|uniref:hypothetical protein n=1 Tax=Streptomyces sp. E11-3 TaxID=3110112 RepID=UPI00397F4E2E